MVHYWLLRNVLLLSESKARVSQSQLRLSFARVKKSDSSYQNWWSYSWDISSQNFSHWIVTQQGARSSTNLSSMLKMKRVGHKGSRKSKSKRGSKERTAARKERKATQTLAIVLGKQVPILGNPRLLNMNRRLNHETRNVNLRIWKRNWIRLKQLWFKGKDGLISTIWTVRSFKSLRFKYDFVFVQN